MANEIRGVSPSGTLCVRIMNPAGLIWNGSAFETYTAAHYSTYCLAMTEQGDSGVYVANFPTAILTGGTYEFFVHRQSDDVTPAEGDPIINTGKIDWTGTLAATSISGAMSGSDFRDYVIRRGLKRTDKDTELYEAVTDAIEIMRERFSFDEAEIEAQTTDRITVDGDFKLDQEDDLGLMMGLILEDGTTGTQLEKISKARFDELYSFINADTNYRGYPKHYSLYAGKIYIGPTPDSTDYVYRICYSQRAGAIVASTVGVPFTNGYRHILADLTLSRLYDSLEEYDKAGYYSQKFEAGFLVATRRERVNAGNTSFNMRPSNI